MAAPTLDRKRPFGTISGDSQGRCFEQDNKFFMADGSVWVEPDEAPPEAPPDEAPTAKPALAKKGKAGGTQLDAQLGA